MKIRMKFALVIFVIVIGGIMLSMTGFYFFSSENAADQAIEGNMDLSSAIHEAVYLLMRTGNQDELENYLKKAGKFPSISEITVILSNAMESDINEKKGGRVQSTHAKDDLELQAFGSGQKIARKVTVGSARAIRTITPIIADSLCMSCHAKAKKGDVLAVLSTTLVYQSHLDEMMRQLIASSLTQGIIAVFVIGAIFLFFDRLVMKPVLRIGAAVQKFGKGDWTALVDLKPWGLKKKFFTKEGKVSPESLDEIGELGVAFNEMVRDLKEVTVSRDELMREVVERKQAEENLASLGQKNELILSSVVEGIMGLDLRGNHTFVNPAAAKMLGYEVEELIGHPSHSIWHHTKSDGSPYPEEECRIHVALQEGMMCRVSTEVFWRKDGTSFPVEYSSTPLREQSRVVGVVITFFDITERKLLTEAENARIAAELANKSRGQFLAAMSHEMRTPLNAVIGFADILSGMPLDDEQRKYSDTINSSGRLLLNLINDILDFSKIEAGKIVFEEIDFDLEYLAKDVFNIISTRISGADISTYVDFDKDVPIHVKGDPTRMRQILINLLNNAAKFTDRGEIGLIVRLSDETLSPEEPVFLIAVKDTGIGIPKDKQASLLFRRFSQVDMSTTRKYGGTGLGLSICKALVEKMGGRIWVESEENAGSEFKFTAKFKRGATPAESKMALLAKEKFAGKKILIVDDNKASQEVLRMYCHDMGLSVIFVASSAKEAIDHIRELAGAYPDMILSDIRMAGIDGYQLVEKLNALFPGSGMKFIAVTSDIWFAAAKELENRGFHGFVTKPVIRGDLAIVIAAVFGDRREEKKIVTRHAANEFACKDLRVLVAEDAETNRMLIGILLTKWGCVCDFAENGKEALEKLRANQYDVCLMDLQMPVMGGLEAVRIIRREISRVFPVIALTAAAMDDDRSQCMSAGMTDYLAKPINVDELKKKLIMHGRPA